MTMLRASPLWMRSGQLTGPQAVDGRFAPRLWRTAAPRRPFEQSPAPGALARRPSERRSRRARRDGAHGEVRIRRGCLGCPGAGRVDTEGEPSGHRGGGQGAPKGGGSGAEARRRTPREVSASRASARSPCADRGSADGRVAAPAVPPRGEQAVRVRVRVRVPGRNGAARCRPTRGGALCSLCRYAAARACQPRRVRRAGARPDSAVLDPVGEFGDLVVDGAALGHQRADLAVRVHHRGVVPPAELRTDLRQ